ncbi:MAG: cyclic nucleotide-binding domain-containing protein, partial [Pseudomonadota bacterium]|nr:cyclic nucleotide-binding domain-containing protein [Pseudomonadota bacterium]
MNEQENQTQPSRAPPPPWAAGTEHRQHELYPELDDEQINIVRQYGEEREVADGTLLWNIGDRNCEFFLVLEGALEIFRRTDRGEHVIVTHGPGRYSGETVTLSGRGTLVGGRAKGHTRVLAVST